MTREEFDEKLRALVDEYRPSGWAKATVVVTPWNDDGEPDAANADTLNIRSTIRPGSTIRLRGSANVAGDDGTGTGNRDQVDGSLPRVTAEQVAKKLDVSPNRARQMIRRGEIQGVKIGRYIRTTWAWVDEYLKSQRTQNADTAGQ